MPHPSTRPVTVAASCFLAGFRVFTRAAMRGGLRLVVDNKMSLPRAVKTLAWYRSTRERGEDTLVVPDLV